MELVELCGGGKMWLVEGVPVKFEQPGVFEHCSGVWVATFWVGGFPYPMGTYATELEAVYACNLGYAIIDRNHIPKNLARLAEFIPEELRRGVDSAVPFRVEEALRPPESRFGERVNENSGYRGVSWDSSGGWKARVSYHGRSVQVGKFPSADEAALAYNACIRELDATLPEVNRVPENRVDSSRRVFLELKGITAADRWENSGSKRGFRWKDL